MLAAVIEETGAVVARGTAPPWVAGLPLILVAQAGIRGTERTLAADGLDVAGR
jgi:hypothetical protein